MSNHFNQRYEKSYFNENTKHTSWHDWHRKENRDKVGKQLKRKSKRKK